MNSVTIYAKERGQAPTHLPRSTNFTSCSFLDVVIPPTSPLYVGQRVRIQTLTRIMDRGDRRAAGYVAEPAGITGTITGVRTMELAITEFIITNDDLLSDTEFAYLAVQHIPGVTVRLEFWRTVLRTLLLPVLPHTRHIPLEWDADTIPGAYLGRSGRFRSVGDDAEDLVDGVDESGSEEW